MTRVANKLNDVWKWSTAADPDTFNGILLLLLMLSATALAIPILSFVVILAVMALWQVVFNKPLTKLMNWRFFYSACLLTLLVPINLPLWQLVLCTSLGVVFGEQIFGGRGHSFLSAVVVSLAFIFYAFPHDSSALIDSVSIFWLLLPAAALVLFRTLDWMTLSGMILGTIVMRSLTHVSPDAIPTEFALTPAIPASFGLCVLFILCDTRLVARTLSGKWLSGALFSLLIVYLNPTFADFDQLVFALLLTSIAIPLLDALADEFNHMSQLTTDKGSMHE